MLKQRQMLYKEFQKCWRLQKENTSGRILEISICGMQPLDGIGTIPDLHCLFITNRECWNVIMYIMFPC